MNIDEIEKLLKEGKFEDALKIAKKEASGIGVDNYAGVLNDWCINEAETAYTLKDEAGHKLVITGFKVVEKLAKNKELIESVKGNRAQTHHSIGFLLQSLNRFKEAEKEYREAVKLEDRLPDKGAHAHNNLGLVLKILGRNDEAEQEYREAIRINPNFASPHSNLGLLLQNLGKYEEAEKNYRKAIKIYPNLLGAYINLGRLLDILKRYDEAEATYKEAIRINPDCAELHNNLGALFRHLHKFDDAVKEYRKAFEICDNINTKRIIARHFCILYFAFFEKEKIKEHRGELEKIKGFFIENNDSKEFLVDACNSHQDMMEYFSAKKYNKAKNKLEEVKSYLKKCDEKQLLEFVDRTKDLILLDEKFNHLIGLLPVYQKNEILKLISNLSDEAETLSEKEFIIEEFIKHYILCVKTFNKCFDLFRYEKPIFINTKELLETEDFFVNFGFGVDKNPANSVILVANKINECSNKITENSKKKKEIIYGYWNVKIKEILTTVIPELNGFAISNMINTEAYEQTTKELKTLGGHLMRIDERTEIMGNKLDELLKIAKSTEKTIEYIEKSIEKASSENKELLEKLIELTKRYEELHEETNENLNSINCILTELISSEDTEGIKKVAITLTKEEIVNKVVGHVKGEENKSKLKKAFEQLKKKVEKLPEDVEKDLYKNIVIKPITKAIMDIIDVGVEKSPEVIAEWGPIFMRLAPTIISSI